MQVFGDYVVIVRALEQIHQANDVLVLAYLQHVYLSSLLNDLNRLHIPLADSLYRYSQSRPEVLPQPHFSKLAMSKSSTERIVISDDGSSYLPFQNLAPSDLFFS